MVNCVIRIVLKGMLEGIALEIGYTACHSIREKLVTVINEKESKIEDKKVIGFR